MRLRTLTRAFRRRCSRKRMFLLLALTNALYIILFCDVSLHHYSLRNYLLGRFSSTFCSVLSAQSASAHLHDTLTHISVCRTTDSNADSNADSDSDSASPCSCDGVQRNVCASSSCSASFSIREYNFPLHHSCLIAISKQAATYDGERVPVPALLHMVYNSSEMTYSYTNYLSVVSLVRYAHVPVRVVFVWNDGALPIGKWWFQMMQELSDGSLGNVSLFSVVRRASASSSSSSSSSSSTGSLQRKLEDAEVLMLYGGVLSRLDVATFRDLSAFRHWPAAIFFRNATSLRVAPHTLWPDDAFLFFAEHGSTLFSLLHKQLHLQIASERNESTLHHSSSSSLADFLRYTSECAFDAFVHAVAVTESVNLDDDAPLAVGASLYQITESEDRHTIRIRRAVETCDALANRTGNYSSRASIAGAVGSYQVDYYESHCAFYCFPSFTGRQKVPGENQSVTTLEQTAVLHHAGSLNNCGRFEPPLCLRPQRVALLVTFRNRELQLRFLLAYLHRFLQKQFVQYTIFVIEQTGTGEFNKGALYNSGFLEARRAMNGSLDCVILHDVDLLPEDDRILYMCDRPSIVRHLSEGVDTLGYRVHYASLVGGVTAIRAADFALINGFSNLYFGWGAEDDDLFDRMNASKLIVRGYSLEVSRYKMMKINHVSASPSSVRYKLWFHGDKRRSTDGLNSIGNLYNVSISCRQTHTHIQITLDEVGLMKVREEALSKIK